MTNTGGGATVVSGNANSGVSLMNMANMNKASLPCGGCAGNSGTGSVLISGNGADSANHQC